MRKINIKQIREVLRLHLIANLLERDFYASSPDEKYVGDIIYIPTNEDRLYLATVVDLYFRRIVGWSMDDTMKVSLVNDALNMALISRKPSKGLICHLSSLKKKMMLQVEAVAWNVY